MNSFGINQGISYISKILNNEPALNKYHGNYLHIFYPYKKYFYPAKKELFEVI